MGLGQKGDVYDREWQRKGEEAACESGGQIVCRCWRRAKCREQGSAQRWWIVSCSEEVRQEVWADGYQGKEMEWWVKWVRGRVGEVV